MSKRKSIYLASTAGALSLAMFAANPAAAQDQPPAPPAQTSPAAAQAAAEAPVIQEVTVTARRRNESLLSTPVAVTAFDSLELQRKVVNNLGDIQQSTPSLVFEGTAGDPAQARIFIRGVGNANPGNFQDPGVGIYIVGLYYGRSGGAVLENVDIAQIEVLRGPQGTLFGRNTIGGAINITTTKPSETFSALASIAYGNYNDFRGHGSINLPLVPGVLAFRASVTAERSDGWSVNDVNGQKFDNIDKTGVSGAFRFTPNEQLTIDLNGMYTRDRGRGRAYSCQVIPGVVSAISPTLKAFFGVTYEEACRASAANGPRHFSTDLPETAYADVISVGSTIAYHIGQVGAVDLTIKGIGGYIKEQEHRIIDFDATRLLLIDTFDVNKISAQTYSGEFQILGNTINNRLNFVVGAYYSAENTPGHDIRYTDVFPFLDPFVAVPSNINQFIGIDNTSLAGYGQATFNVTDIVSITAGVRYTSESKGIFVKKFFVKAKDIYTPVPFPAKDAAGHLIKDENGNQVYRTYSANDGFSRDFSDVSPMVGIQVKAPRSYLDGTAFDQLMGYFTYSQGFKSGGFNGNGDTVVNNLTSFRPEKVDSFEIGVKGSAMDHRLTMSLALYHMKYNDIQLAVTGVNNAGAPIATVLNAGRATVDGFEGEMVAMLTENLRLDVNGTWTDARYDEFKDGAFDRSNEPFTFIPPWKLTIGLENRIELNNLGVVTPRIEVNAQGPRYLIGTRNDAQRAQGREPAVTLLNAQIRWQVRPDITITAYGKNLTDKLYRNDGLAISADVFYYAAPRTYGLELKKTF